MAIRNIPVDLDNGTVMIPADLGSPEPKTRKGVITEYPIVTIRAKPSKHGLAIGYVRADAIVNILDEEYGNPDTFEKYYKIRFGTHQVGYVCARLVRRC